MQYRLSWYPIQRGLDHIRGKSEAGDNMKEIHLTIPGNVVSKKNSKIACMVGGRNCTRRPMILPSKAYTIWEKQSRLFLWGNGQTMSPTLTCPVHIEAHFYCKGTLPDLSGAMESIADCLEGLIYENDRQIYSWDGSRVHHDKANPRTEVVIKWEE